MKLLHFCNLVPNKSGAYEYLLAGIGHELQKHGDRMVIVFAGDPSPAVADLLRAADVQWHVVGSWSDGHGGEHPWAIVFAALRFLREEQPDVVAFHFGNELPSLAIRTFACGLGSGRVGWVWEQDQQIGAPSTLTSRVSRIRMVGTAFDRVVAVYDGGRESLLRRHVPAERIALIYNSVGDHQSTREPGWLRRDLELPGSAVLAVSTAWLVPRKRVDFLLRGFAGALPLPADAAHLIILGDGPERGGLEQQARELGLAGRTHFLGRRNDVRDILTEANLLVHCSAAETCTYAITEAMCAGIPPVVTEAGAAREQIVDGTTGFVLAKDDLRGFSERLRQLVEDDALRREMGALARVRWNERYRLERAAAQYAELYRSVAAGVGGESGS